MPENKQTPSFDPLKLLRRMIQELIRGQRTLDTFKEQLELVPAVKNALEPTWAEPNTKEPPAVTTLRDNIIEWLIKEDNVVTLFVHFGKGLIRYFPETFVVIEEIWFITKGITPTGQVAWYGLTASQSVLPARFVSRALTTIQQHSRPITDFVTRPISRHEQDGARTAVYVPVQSAGCQDAAELYRISSLGNSGIIPNGDDYHRTLFLLSDKPSWIPPRINMETVIQQSSVDFWTGFFPQFSAAMAMNPLQSIFLMMQCIALVAGAAIDSRAYIVIIAPWDYSKSTGSRVLSFLFNGTEFCPMTIRAAETTMNIPLLVTYDNLETQKETDREKVFDLLAKNTIQGVDAEGISNRNIVILNAQSIDGLPLAIEIRSIYYRPERGLMAPTFSSQRLEQMIRGCRNEFWYRTILLLKTMIERPTFHSTKAELATGLSGQQPNLRKIREHLSVMFLLAQELDPVIRKLLGISAEEAFVQFVAQVGTFRNERIMGAPATLAVAITQLFAQAFKNADWFKKTCGLEYDDAEQEISGPVVAGWLNKALKKYSIDMDSNSFLDKLNEEHEQLRALGFVPQTRPGSEEVYFKNHHGKLMFSIKCLKEIKDETPEPTE
jgi:hypothetical protein